MIVLHANWTSGGLYVWGEEAVPGASAVEGRDRHPTAMSAERLTRLFPSIDSAPGTFTLRLPTQGGTPIPSPSVAHAAGHVAHAPDDDRSAGARSMEPWQIEGLRCEPGAVEAALEQIEEHASMSAGSNGDTCVLGDSARFFAVASRFARSLVAMQRIVPSVAEQTPTRVVGRWEPWLHDQATSQRLAVLVGAMPASARAAVDAFDHQGERILVDFLGALVDTWARRALVRESMIEAIEGRDSQSDLQVAWLAGLLGPETAIPAAEARHTMIARTVRRWLSTLEDRGAGGAWRLCLKLSEPIYVGALPDLSAPGNDIEWTLSFHLQSVDSPELMVDAEDVWALRAESASVAGRRIDNPQDLLLKELARAARLCKVLDSALAETHPGLVSISTVSAYEFLREIRPILLEQGFGVIVPEWWESPAARIGARLKIDAPPVDAGMGSPGAPGGSARAHLGLGALVGYEWQLAVGDAPLTLEEFQKLAAERAPLVRIDGRWVEVRAEDVRAAMEFIRQNPGGQMRVADALRLAYRSDISKTGVPILGLDASGWLATLMDASTAPVDMPMLETPEGFHGELRPYQTRGLSWLSFLDSMGMGPCLADDMGLGKTIQLLALLVHERRMAESLRERGVTEPEQTEIGPTLLVVPMSIVANWKREATRFAPSIRVLVHHGAERRQGQALFHEAIGSDLVITTYALAHRDREVIELIPWRRVVLDEAQNIKNPSAKQSQAVRNLPVTRRIALTGTPLENRLAELWSIMDFCNPGYLGTLNDFRSYFAVPVERFHDRERARKLRALVKPFILRRLKTDPTVISDLPAKVETKEFCKLTSEQASLYEACVKETLTQVERAEGIRRRGMVLTALIRLKQICNHPQQLPNEDGPQPIESAEPARSGKMIRLLELLEEVIAADEQALVFTQFRQMAVLLGAMLRRGLDREVLVLHGGTSQTQRQQMIDRFQRGDRSAPVLVLSLKAGGVGLNLTAASHVFHFDRWWNPAVENQATDRAFRIGQTRRVSVHKFIVSGTLEDRIDQMIEGKLALAEDVIGSGEDWLTELSTAQLREILTLRPEALADE